MSRTDALLNEEKFVGNTDAFEKLRAKLDEGCVIPFVGAGASVPLVPTWNTALNSIVNEAIKQGQISKNDGDFLASLDTGPLDVAQLVHNAIGARVFQSRIAQLFCIKGANFTETHRLIAQLPSK